jgi:hypothetical protein
MDILKTIVKSFIWGLLLLSLTIIVLIEGFNFFNKVGDVRSAEYPAKVESLLKEIKPQTDTLLSLMKKYDFQRTSDEQKLIAVEKAIVRLLINKRCGDCELGYFNPNEKYELESYLESLSRKASLENNSLRNRNLFIGMAGAILCIGLTIYLAACLIVNRKSFSLLILQFLSFLPFILIAFSISSITTDSEYFYTQLGYKNSSFNWWILGSSIFYFFTIYPAIFAVAKKLNFTVKNIYSLKT